MARLLTLPEFLAAEAGLPFELGKNDCAHFIARWALVRTGRDCLAIHGGLPREVAEQLLLRRRFLRGVFTSFRSIGLKRTDTPEAGDVGVIRTENWHRCAIRTATGWVYRDEAGIGSIRAEDCKTLLAWRT